VLRGRKQRKAEAAGTTAGSATPANAPTGSKAPNAPKAPRAPKPPRRRVPKGPARQTRMTRLVGLAFCLAGFGAIGAGWAGAAGKDCVECQIPYLLSGGAAGIGLLIFGVGMMMMAQVRTEGRRLADRLDQWRSSALAEPNTASAPNGSEGGSQLEQTPQPEEYPATEAPAP
jgi:hypothetical protein